MAFIYTRGWRLVRVSWIVGFNYDRNTHSGDLRLEREAWVEGFNHYSNIHMGLETRASSMGRRVQPL